MIPVANAARPPAVELSRLAARKLRSRLRHTMIMSNQTRRLSAGVEMQEDGVAHARVWAPACRTVEIVRRAHGGPRRSSRLERDAEGFFSGAIENVRAGDRYWYQLDRTIAVGRTRSAGSSRMGRTVRRRSSIRRAFHGPTQLGPASAAKGRCCTSCTSGRSRRKARGRRRATRLEDLAADRDHRRFEMMPVADFAGRLGWGYDGVNLYAPTRLYGTPDDLRRFVDRAHALGLARDPRRRLQPPRARRQLPRRLSRATTSRIDYSNDWGQSLNFEGPAPGARPSSRRTAPTGSTSFTSTGSGSTRRRTSTTRRRSTC